MMVLVHLFFDEKQMHQNHHSQQLSSFAVRLLQFPVLSKVTDRLQTP
jgi:hypothetical protein